MEKEMMTIAGIEILKNDYKRPTEARKWVVQAIVDHFMWRINCDKPDWEWRHWLAVQEVKLKYDFRVSEDDFAPDWPVGQDCRVRNSEMTQAWDILSSAGYYCFTVTTSEFRQSEHGYVSCQKVHWDKKPYWEGKKRDEKALFGLFID